MSATETKTAGSGVAVTTDDKNGLNNARALVVVRAPYFASVMFKMKVIWTDALPTLATDKRWRLYINPEYVRGLDLNTYASALIHEIGHCVRDHLGRFESMNQPQRLHPLFNIAGDACINHDLSEQGMPVDEGWVSFDGLRGEGFEVDPGMTAEAIFRLLAEKFCEQCGQPSDQGDQGDQQGQQDQGGSGQDDQDGQQGQQDQGGSGQDDQDGQDGQQGQQNQSGSGQDDQQGQQGQGNQDGQQGQGGQGGKCGGCGKDKPQGMPQSRCGSSSGGEWREWEDSNDTESGVDAASADLSRREVAEGVKRHVQQHGRGSVPGGLEFWADEVLNPKVDWKKVLRGEVRQSIGNIIGKLDYDRRRPSRRQPPAQNGRMVILPGMVKPKPPQIEVIVDTSGSVADEEIAQALGEIEGINRTYGRHGNPVRVTFCDMVPSETQKVVGSVKNLRMSGRGGTDMRVGIEAAAARKAPKNGIIITITDGETPWPDAPPAANPTATYIVCLVRDSNYGGNPPEWMRTIHIPVGE